MDEPVSKVMVKIVEASSGDQLKSAILSRPLILALEIAQIRQVMTQLSATLGGGPLVKAALNHRTEVMERLIISGYAGMTADMWSGNPDTDWLMPVSLAEIMDKISAMMFLAANQPGTVTPEDLVETIRLAYDHAGMADAPAIVRAAVGRDLAVALRSQLKVRPDAEEEREAARLESEARDHGINF